jgi:hypothetical protein
MRQLRDVRRAFVLGAALGSTWLSIEPALGASFIVTTNADSGTGSLRDAISQANALGDSSNTITFDLANQTSSTITLTAALPNISVPLVIDGSAATGLVVQGNGTSLVAIQSNPTRFQSLDIRGGTIWVLQPHTLAQKPD